MVIHISSRHGLVTAGGFGLFIDGTQLIFSYLLQ